MAGIYNGYGGGLLPFDARWSPVQQALESGQFDPQGINAFGLLNPQALAYAGAGNLPAQQPQFSPQPQGMPVGLPRNEELNIPSMPQAQSPQFQPSQMAAQGGGGFFDRIGQGIANNPLTLMALGGGIAQGGIGRGLTASAPIAFAERNQHKQEAAQGATYQALLKAGLPEGVAQAAALNPEMLKTIAPEYFGGFKVVQTGEDALGNKIFSLQGPGGKLHPINVEGQAGGGTSGLLASGVTQFDNSKSGDEYLAQFSPEIQAAVKAYVEGRSMPTGNPRKGFTQFVKQAAQKYGSDIGVPADDATFAARRTMRNDLAKTTPGSMGGQITFARTSLNHLEQVAKAAEALDNKDLGFTWGSQAINSLRGLSTEQAAKVAALQDAAQHYGQEVTKFYAGSPGGEAERQRFLTALNGAKSPKELAAVIAQEKALIPERLGEIGNRIEGLLGSEGTKQYPIHSPESQKAIGSIDATVARMRGLASAAAPQNAAPSGIREGATATNPKTGQKVIFKGGQWIQQ